MSTLPWGSTSFIRRGFCIFAQWALEQAKSGRVHFISSPSDSMPICGVNTRERPTPMKTVRRRRITCRRCLTIALLTVTRGAA